MKINAKMILIRLRLNTLSRFQRDCGELHFNDSKIQVVTYFDINAALIYSLYLI